MRGFTSNECGCVACIRRLLYVDILARVQKNPGFFKEEPNPVGFIGFFGQAGKIGKIMQKL